MLTIRYHGVEDLPLEAIAIAEDHGARIDVFISNQYGQDAIREKLSEITTAVISRCWEPGQAALAHLVA